MVISWFGPWKAVTKSAQHFITHPDDDGWRQSKLTELNVVNITGALIASVVTGALAWEAMPWTTQALFYSTLILSLTSVSTASQQSIALYRLGGHRDGLEAVHRLLQASTKGVSNIKVYVWQLPVMLLNVSIALFIIGLVILVWDHAARKASWDRDMKIAFVATLAGVFALANYILGTTVLYRSHQNELEGVPEALSQQQNGNTNAVASNGSTDGDTPGPRNVQSGLPEHHLY